MYTHNCIKCFEKYEDQDPDPYYCPACVEVKKQLAAEIDKKQIVHTLPTKSDLQIYDEICKARGSRFVNIKDMGISL